MEGSDTQSGQQEAMTAVEGGLEDPYPPDADDLTGEQEDGGEEPHRNIPVPRAAAVRAAARGKLQVKKAKVKTPKSVAKASTRILVQEKRRKALELRKAGATYDAIANAVGYNDASAARKAVLKAMGDVIQEPVAELRTMQVERLNHMLMTIWPKVQQGDETAINTALRVMDKIDRLMGTDAPQETHAVHDVKAAVLVVDGNKDDYIAAMKKMAGVVNPDGTNATPALPASTMAGATPPSHALDGGQPMTGNPFPPGMGPMFSGADEVIDAELVEDPALTDQPEASGDPKGAVNQTQELTGNNGQTTGKQRRFNFGVEPTVQR